MKSLFNTLLYLLFFISFNNGAYSLSDNQIKQLCQNKPKRSNCTKILKSKQYNLLQGNRIEIPVIPYKK